MMPRKPLVLESWVERTSFFPLRIVGSELISSTAAFIPIFDTLPLIVLKEKIAPMFTTSGFESFWENPTLQSRDKHSATHKFIFGQILIIKPLTPKMESKLNKPPTKKKKENQKSALGLSNGKNRIKFWDGTGHSQGILMAVRPLCNLQTLAVSELKEDSS